MPAASQYGELIARCRAYLVHAGNDEFFSHSTALLLHGIPVDADPRTLHVSVATPRFPPQVAGVTGHRLSRPVPVATVRGIRCSAPIDAWVQAASEVGLEALVIAGDGLLRRTHPLATVERLADAVRRAERRPGAKRLRAALELVRPGTDSPAETRLRLLVLRAGLPEPIIGHRVFDSGGFFVGVPDLAWPEQRVALDYDGDVHRTDRHTFRDDVERGERYRDAGWTHLRATGDHLIRFDRLERRIRGALSFSSRE